MTKRMTEDQAKKTYERALKMEQEFAEYFTGERPEGFLERCIKKFNFLINF